MSGGEVERRSGEVHFKRRHLPDHPSGGIQWPPNNPDRYQNRQINVDRFCHDTHMKTYEQIRQENGGYAMIPRMKSGKETYRRDGQLKGGTYTPIGNDTPAEINGDTGYRRIETERAVLPGYYIWWSIHVDNADNPDDLPPYIVKLSIPFIHPPQSRYGKKRISTSSLHLLQSYQDGFVNNGHYPHLQFRNGGTLRYMYEICYVVIVCAEGHFTGADDDYPHFPAFNIEYADDSGRITSVGQWSVTIRNGKSTVRKHPDRLDPSIPFSWDHYAFAFHFPDKTRKMIIPSDDDLTSLHYVKDDHVTHTYELCIKKEITRHGRFGCPDQL